MDVDEAKRGHAEYVLRQKKKLSQTSWTRKTHAAYMKMWREGRLESKKNN